MDRFLWKPPIGTDFLMVSRLGVFLMVLQPLKLSLIMEFYRESKRSGGVEESFEKKSIGVRVNTEVGDSGTKMAGCLERKLYQAAKTGLVQFQQFDPSSFQSHRSG